MSSTDLVLRIIRLLDQLAIPYMLVGSYSSNYFGRPRSTRDADFVVATRPNRKCHPPSIFCRDVIEVRAACAKPCVMVGSGPFWITWILRAFGYPDLHDDQQLLCVCLH